MIDIDIDIDGGEKGDVRCTWFHHTNSSIFWVQIQKQSQIFKQMQIHLQNSKKRAGCTLCRVTSVAKNDEKISLQGFKDILILFIRRSVWLLSGM